MFSSGGNDERLNPRDEGAKQVPAGLDSVPLSDRHAKGPGLYNSVPCVSQRASPASAKPMQPYHSLHILCYGELAF